MAEINNNVKLLAVFVLWFKCVWLAFIIMLTWVCIFLSLFKYGLIGINNCSCKINIIVETIRVTVYIKDPRRYLLGLKW